MIILAFGLGSIAGTAGATNNKAVAIGYNAIAYSLNDVVIGANQTAITANYGRQKIRLMGLTRVRLSAAGS